MKNANSQENHNCYSYREGYLKSYEYIGNCYIINDNEINFEKIIIDKNDESFAIVQSCRNTEKKLKINSTGECVSHCPEISGYKNYIYNFTNFTSQNYNPNIPQYQEIEEILPKYNLGDLCIEAFPPDYEADDINNICICISESCMNLEKENDIQHCIPYIIHETGIIVNFYPPIEILENICRIIFDDYLEEITNNIESIIFDDTLLGDEEIVIFGNNIDFQITKSYSDIKYNNVSQIDFGECEEILKKQYNIDYLLIFKFDIIINDTIPSKIEYNVYNPETKEKLNLSICENKNKYQNSIKFR